MRGQVATGIVVALLLGLLVASCAPAAQPAAPAPAAEKPAPRAEVKVEKAAPPKPTAVTEAKAAPKPVEKAVAKPEATAAPKVAEKASPQRASSLKLGATGTAGDAGIYIALEKGYFKQEGIEVELVNFPTGDMMVPPLGTGELHVGGSVISAGLFNAIGRDIPLKITADKGSVFQGRTHQSIVARKDLYDSGAIKEFSDLKGKSFGMTAYGNSVDVLLDMILKQGNLTRNDIEVKLMSFPNMNVAFANKALDTALHTEPNLTAAVEAGSVVRWKTMADVYPDQQVSAILYSPHLDPQIGKQFMVAYVKGLRDYTDAFVKNKGQDQVISILTKSTNIKDPALWKKMQPSGLNPDGYVNAKSIASDLQWYVAQGHVKVTLDLNKVVANEYADYAVQKLGKYQ